MALKNIPKLPASKIVPQGSNSLSNKNKFQQNVNYERFFNHFLTTNNLSNSLFFDSRFENKNYFKLDTNNSIINLNQENIKEVPKTRGVYALPFVVDAYMEVEKNCKAYYNNGTFTDKIFGEMTAKTGWIDLNDKYHEYMTSIYNKFLNYIQKKYKNIYNFKDFLKYFTLFLKDICDKTPICKSTYVYSSSSHINMTGMAIEFDNSLKDDDKYKFTNYFQSEDFDKFQKICQTNGFLIDKYCPWRLVFDIKNPNAEKRYLKNYILDSENIYDKYFVRTALYDVDILISYCVIFYNTFINDNTFVEKPKLINSNTNSLSIEIESVIRDQEVNYVTANNMMGEKFWYDFYFYILFLEYKVNIDQIQFESYIKLLTKTYMSDGLVAAYDNLSKILESHTKTNDKKFILVF